MSYVIHSFNNNNNNNYIPEMMLTDYMYHKRRDEEDLPALKTALTHQYNDLRTT